MAHWHVLSRSPVCEHLIRRSVNNILGDHHGNEWRLVLRYHVLRWNCKHQRLWQLCTRTVVMNCHNRSPKKHLAHSYYSSWYFQYIFSTFHHHSHPLFSLDHPQKHGQWTQHYGRVVRNAGARLFGVVHLDIILSSLAKNQLQKKNTLHTDQAQFHSKGRKQWKKHGETLLTTTFYHFFHHGKSENRGIATQSWRAFKSNRSLVWRAANSDRTTGFMFLHWQLGH